MTLGPEGCGIVEHPESCLCDVVLTSTSTTTVRIPYGMMHGEAIAHYGKWDGTLVHWFELMDIAWEGIRKHRREQEDNAVRRPPEATGFKRTLPDDVYEYLVDGIRRGVNPTPLRDEITEKFGVTINKSYVTKLKQRLIERGQL